MHKNCLTLLHYGIQMLPIFMFAFLICLAVDDLVEPSNLQPKKRIDSDIR